MDKNQSNWSQAIRKFFCATTLHGFKYLFSELYMDRVGWLICCCASTCCAALLCTVLWSRFLEVPALMELWDLQSEETPHQNMPLVVVCPPVDASAALLVDRLTTNATLAKEAKNPLAQVLSMNPTSVQRLQLLEMLLSAKNITLSELVYHMISCEQLMTKCRWENMIVPCESLFMKELTSWGICCVMRPSQVLYSKVQSKSSRFQTSIGLDLALQCSDDPTQGCGFFATFEMDETEEPMFIKPGFNHFARLRFTSIPQNSVEELVGIACNPKKDYSKANCLAKCAERACGCTNPLHSKNYFVQNRLPMCTITQLPCLKTHQNKSKCNCLPCCNKVTTYVTLESGRMDVLNSALDPMYSELNATSSVLHLRVYISLSRIFTTNPTETWLSLLSSLGGVFNMFLGVGLFSGLEILFLLFVKLPIAFRKSSEITNPPSSRY